MKYQLIVLDIDGTLLPHRAERVTRAVADAVNAVQAAGVKVAIATGRARSAIPPRLLRGIRPDYFICANGAQVTDRGGNLLFADTMTPEEMYALVDFCENYEHPLAFVFDDGYYAYVEADRMRAAYAAVAGSAAGVVLDGEDQDHHLQMMPFDAFCAMPPEGVAAFQEKYGYLDLRFYDYAPGRYDIVPGRTDKAKGLGIVLEHTGLSAAGAVAVGDAANDLAMLRLAGCGVAVATAPEAVRAEAALVCPAAAGDGVATLCRTLFPEAFAHG